MAKLKPTEKFVKAVRKNMAVAISAAFALVIALAWNEAIKEGVNSIVEKLNIPHIGYLFNIITAVIITVICIIGILIFSKWAEKK